MMVFFASVVNVVSKWVGEQAGEWPRPGRSRRVQF